MNRFSRVGPKFFLFSFFIFISLSYRLAYLELPVDSWVLLLVQVILAIGFRQLIFSNVTLTLKPTTLSKQKTNVYLFGVPQETLLDDFQEHNRVRALLSPLRFLLIVISVGIVFFMHFQFVKNFSIPEVFPLLIAVSILPIAKLTQFLLPIFIASIAVLKVQGILNLQPIWFAVWGMVLLVTLGFLYLSEQEIRSAFVFQSKTFQHLFREILLLSLGFLGVVFVVHKVLPEKEDKNKNLIVTHGPILQKIDQPPENFKLPRNQSLDKIDESLDVQSLKKIENLIKKHEDLQRHSQDYSKRAKEALEEHLQTELEDELRNLKKVSKDSLKENEEFKKMDFDLAKKMKEMDPDVLSQIKKQSSELANQLSQSAKSLKPENEVPETSKGEEASIILDTKPDKKPKDNSVFRDRILIVLIMTAILVVLLKVFRKPKKIKDSKTVQSVDEKFVKKLIEGFKEIDQKKLGAKQEVIQKYKAFLTIMEAMQSPKPEWMPPSHFVSLAIEQLPQVTNEIGTVTEAFSDVLYGMKEPQLDVLNKFRTSCLQIVAAVQLKLKFYAKKRSHA